MKPNDYPGPERRATLKPVTHQQIAALAHEIWLGRGCPNGNDLDIWLEAERELQGGLGAGPMHRDPIPADPQRVTPDEDPAVNDGIRGELDRAMGDAGGVRSPTSANLTDRRPR